MQCFFQLDFLKKYGYLQSGTSNSEALHTEASITEAIKQMQLFGGLQPSGEMNEDTLKVHGYNSLMLMA